MENYVNTFRIDNMKYEGTIKNGKSTLGTQDTGQRRQT